jgi:hypothetical protein
MNAQDNRGPLSSTDSCLALDPADWYLATWRDLPPQVRPSPAPFDLAQCVDRLRKLRVSRYGAIRDWDEVYIPVSMTAQEAHFWLRAMIEGTPHARISRLVQRLGKQTFDGQLSTENVLVMAHSAGRALPGKMLAPLAQFLSPVQILDLLLPTKDGLSRTLSPRFHGVIERDLAKSFGIVILPYLTAEERAELRERLRPEITPDRWTNSWHSPPPLAFRLAAQLGLHQELQTLVNGWKDEADAWLVHLDIILGLGDPKLVELHARRLSCRPTSPRQLRAWLAHTGTAGLDWIEEVIRERNPGEAADYLDVLCRVKAPSTAPLLLKLKLEGIAPSRVRRWLDANVKQAITGLLPLAAGKGKTADAVLDFLRSAHLRGFTGIIEDQLRHIPAEIAARIQRVVLRPGEKLPPELDDATTPLWLHVPSLDLDEVTLPDWLHSPCLPPLMLNDRRLNQAQVRAVVAALKRSKPGKLQPPLKALLGSQRLDALDTFGWAMFEMWREEGAPRGDNWVMTALTLLGHDGTASRLPACIQQWAREKQGQLATQALDTLTVIQSDKALVQLNTLAMQSRPRWLREKALQQLTQLARVSRMTLAQVEELSIPEVALDAEGGRDLDFGPRQFRALLGADLKPRLRDETGQMRDDLPRPRKTDDPEKAETARQQWSIFKKNLRDAVRLQTARLERFLINRGRWLVPAFKERIVSHPILGRLGRQLLWGGFSIQSELLNAFRLTEEGTFANEQDRECTIDHFPRIGLVHPIHLREQERQAWSEVFGDYEIVPPFAQLGRPFHRLEPGEADKRQVNRFQGVSVSELAILSVLMESGWVHHWNGLRGRLRYFPGADVTAAIGLSGWGQKNIDFVSFFHGAVADRAHLNRDQALKLREVDPVVFSETLADASRLAARGTLTATA